MRSRLLVSAGLLAVAGAARADDLSVTTGMTAPVVTSAASNNSSGNVAITSTGSIIVTGTTPAVSIDSNNSVTNAGTLSTSVASNGVAVRIGGTGLTGAVLANNATISVTGTGGSGNVGVLVSGDPVSGSISSGVAGLISVTGDNALGVSIAVPFTGDIAIRSASVTGSASTAVSVTAPVTGKLSLFGSTTSVGAGGYGLLVAAPISGALRNGGTISVGSTRTVATDGTVTAGNTAVAAARISASIGGGIVNDRYYIDSTGAEVPTASIDTTVDTLVTGFITTTGTAPAVWIAPDATNPQAVTVSAGDTGFSFVNRGQIQTSFGNYDAATTAVLIGGGGAVTALPGGFRQESTGIITASSFDASATAVHLLAGASVSQISNAGNIFAASSQVPATSTTAIGPGGNAYGIVVDQGATLAAIDNSGSITISATGRGNGAYGIADKSGSVATINNSGTIKTSATGTGAVVRAIDLSASNGPVTVTNSGTITGDIVFGSGTSVLVLTGGSVIGTIDFGSGSNLLALSGATTLAQPITAVAPLAISLADTARLDLSKSTAPLSSINASGASVLVIPVLASGIGIAGSANFGGSSSIQLSIQSLAYSQNIAILTAAGGITTDHLGTLVNPVSDRFLFTASAPMLTDNVLSIDLVRKSAADIGLSGAQAAIFNQSIVALPNGLPEAIAIANLPDAPSVIAAYRQLTPPSFGRAAMRAAQSFADTGFGAAAERLSILGNMRGVDRPAGDTIGGTGLGLWAQEIGNFSRQQAGANETAFRNTTLGVAFGVDTRLGGIDAIGAALISNWTSVRQTVAAGLPDAKVSITSVGIQPYAMKSWKGLFVQVNGLAAILKYDSNRDISIDSLASTVIASWGGSQFGAGLTLGGTVKLGPLRITPTNSLSWLQLRQNRYAEAGGGNFNLGVDAQTNTATTNTTRLSVAWGMPVGEGRLEIEGHGAYVHQFNTDPLVTSAHFLSGGDTMLLAGDAINSGGKSFGGGVVYRSDALSLRARYDRRQDNGYTENAVVATLGMAF